MKYLLSLWLVLVPFLLPGQNQAEFEARIFENADGQTLPYRIQYPRHYDQTQSYPLILFLHGAGERGEDNISQLTHGGALFADEANRTRFPAFVVMPQCPSDDSWHDLYTRDRKGDRKRRKAYLDSPTEPLQRVIELLDELGKTLPLDEDRIYLGGLSMGGMGTFELLAREGDRFAAAFPICGGGIVKTAKAYPDDLALWIFHGAEDAVIPAQWSRDMQAALLKAGKESTYTEYPGVNHNSWDNAFAEPDLLPWLFSHSRKK